MSSYEPGVCNIGAEGRRRRVWYAAVGFAVAGAYAAGVLVGVLPDALAVGVFVPLAVGYEWALQAYSSFCVRLALTGRYDFRGEGGSVGRATRPEARRDDRLQAAKITAAAMALAGVTTAALALAVV